MVKHSPHPNNPFHKFHLHHAPRGLVSGLIFVLIGSLSLAWLLLRTGKKPNRITYPCQQIAASNSLLFLAWLGSTLGLTLSTHFSRQSILRFTGVAISLTLIVLGISHLNLIKQFNQTRVIWGQSQPSRVVWLTNTAAANGYNQPWSNKANQTVVNTMMDSAIKALTNQSTVANAWTSLFTTHNNGPNYVAGEKIVIKVNFNNNYDCDNNGCPLLQTVNALLRQLANDKGISQADISLYDVSRNFPDYFISGIQTSFPQIKLNPDRNTSPPCTVSDNVLTAPFGCALANAKYLINMPLLRTHGMAGVTLSFKNHLGSGTWPDRFHNGFFTANSSNSLVQLNNHPFIKDKTMLVVDDAIYGLKNGGPNGYPNFTPNALFLSRDPVAIDSVMTDYLESQGACITCAGSNPRIYMQEGAKVGLGNYATSCTGTNCSFVYTNIDLVRCNPACPGTPSPTSPPQNPSDYDSDGDVDYLDFLTFLRSFTNIFSFNRLLGKM